MAAFEDFQGEVAAAFCPFVGLLGQDGADQAGDGIAMGEDADGVGAAAYFLVEALLGVAGSRSGATRR